MGQPKVASAIWRDRNKRISRDSYEPVGQQRRQTMASKPIWGCDHTKTLNHVSRCTTKFLRKPKWNPLDFPLMGPVCNPFNPLNFDGGLPRRVRPCYTAAPELTALTFPSLDVEMIQK